MSTEKVSKKDESSLLAFTRREDRESHPVFAREWGFAFSEDSPETLSGISLSKTRGLFVDKGFYSNEQASGFIGPENISDEIKVRLGLARHYKGKEWRELDAKTERPWDGDISLKGNPPFLDSSRATKKEASVMEFYSGGDSLAFIKINDFAAGGTKSGAYENKGLGGETFDEEGRIDPCIEDSLSVKNLSEITQIMDEYISKNESGIQRVLYRAVGEIGEFSGVKMHEYAKEAYKVGNTVSFDSFLSTTRTVRSARVIVHGIKLRGKHRVVMFEILTPRGASIQHISEYIDEEEVVLPRGTKYVVVGNYENVQIGAIRTTVVQMIAVDENNDILNIDSEFKTAPMPEQKEES